MRLADCTVPTGGDIASHRCGTHSARAPIAVLRSHTQHTVADSKLRVGWAMAEERDGEGHKGEEGAGDRDSRAASALKQYWCPGLRAVELVLSIIAVGLVAGASDLLHNSVSRTALIYSAYSSFIIITGVLLIARLLGEQASWKTSLGFSVLGVIMFTAAAAVIFYGWHGSYRQNLRPYKQTYDLFIASGVISVINVAVFIIHAFLTFKKEADY